MWVRMRTLFSIRPDMAEEYKIVEAIRQEVVFQGTNLWVLIFAIFLASLGLNTNSTAVIIGAMLISPLMGPIMGMGMGVGINDFELIKKAFRNYAIATVIGILTSALYFYVSPLSEARSELLARTTPTIYDVFIAFFGGMAGIIASSSTKKGNVIPGVAIATALMPPLCTAGYGIATGSLAFFLGALYLYFINTVFICFATLLTVRVLGFSPRVFVDKKREKLVTRYIYFFVMLSLIPSVWMGVDIVRASIFESNVNRFIATELDFPDTRVVSQEIVREKKRRAIEVFLVGEEVPAVSLETARSRMSRYALEDVELVVKQTTAKGITDVGALKAMVLDDLYRNAEARLQTKDSLIEELERDLHQYRELIGLSMEIAPEVKALYPQIQELSLAAGMRVQTGSLERDSVMIAWVRWQTRPDPEQSARMEEWLKARTRARNLILVHQ